MMGRMKLAKRQYKRCSKCKHWKRLRFFRKHEGRLCDKHSWCFTCTDEYFARKKREKG